MSQMSSQPSPQHQVNNKQWTVINSVNNSNMHTVDILINKVVQNVITVVSVDGTLARKKNPQT